MMNNQRAKLATAGLICGSLSIAMAQASVKEDKSGDKKQAMNVLFLISDDMRTDLNSYGREVAQTPNLDKLAAQGVQFEHAYCQYPLSGPSRSSLLTGRRPTTSGLYSNREWFGASHPEWASIPMYFKQNGYTTLRSGKVFHGGIDDTDSWMVGGEARLHTNPITTEKPTYITNDEFRKKNYGMFDLQSDKTTRRPSDRWVALEGKEAENYGDTRVADRAIALIKEYKDSEQPFFLACGFSKPHTPFIAPKQFFDLYKVEDMPLPPDFASLPMVPHGFPEGSIRPRNADLFINRPASLEEAREMIRAYQACISYVDWNIGRVLEELDKQGLRENTIIVFWSDHGYQLGEKGKWSKAGSLWEQGTHIPLLIHDPRAKGNGSRSSRIVELVDLYPTLVDLCGLEMPEGLDGASLRPLLDNPSSEWNRPAYTVWNENDKGVTGIVVRTERWRYAEFFGQGEGAYLTDPINDPHELRNLVNNPEYKDVVSHMHQLVMEAVEGKTELPPPIEK